MHLKHNSKDCLWKTVENKNDTTFVNKKGGNDKHDNLWKLWCEPVDQL